MGKSCSSPLRDGEPSANGAAFRREIAKARESARGDGSGTRRTRQSRPRPRAHRRGCQNERPRRFGIIEDAETSVLVDRDILQDAESSGLVVARILRDAETVAAVDSTIARVMQPARRSVGGSSGMAILPSATKRDVSRCGSGAWSGAASTRRAEDGPRSPRSRARQRLEELRVNLVFQPLQVLDGVVMRPRREPDVGLLRESLGQGAGELVG